MPRILIADDNSNIQKMVTLAFEGAGIEVVSVSNGGAAIRVLSDTAPDLVLADVFMPVRSGYEVCDFIKHEPRFSHVPVVLLVGAFDPLDESEAQRVSADGILKKPFIPPEPLINMVKALLVKSLNERPEVPVAHGEHAAQEEAAKPAAAAAPSVAVEDFADAAPEEFGPSLLEPDFGIHEETLAFGSLLETPIAQQAPGEPASPQAADLSIPTSIQEHRWDDSSDSVGDSIGELAEDEDPESLRPPKDNEFLGADFPELEQIAPSEGMLSEKLLAHAELEQEIDRSSPEPGADFDSEFVPVFPEFDAPASNGAAQPFTSPGEIPASSPESVAFEPINLNATSQSGLDATTQPGLEATIRPELDAIAGPGTGDAAEHGMEEAEPAPAELAGEALIDGEDSGEPARADVVPMGLFSVPVFPGSEKLWAWPPSGNLETKEKADGAKEEITEFRQPAEPEPFPWPVSEPFANSASPAELVPAELAEAAALAPAPEFELVPTQIGADSLTTAAPAAEVAPAAKQAMDPELIEMVVTRIVERMQPKVIDVVTREILRPLVEALVRREINKSE